GGVARGSGGGRRGLVGRPGGEPLPASAYPPDVNRRVYAALADKARRVGAAGHTAIVDAVFAQPEERAQVAAVARASRVPFRGLFLVARLDTRLTRGAARASDASDADAAIVREQGGYQPRPVQRDQLNTPL